MILKDPPVNSLAHESLHMCQQIQNHPHTRLILRCVVVSLFVLYGLCLNALASESSWQRKKIHHQLPRINATVDIDARLDEAIWQQALKISLDYETTPGENTPPPAQTQVYLFENGETLYIGFDARDPDPSKIRGYLTDRDNVWESDFVGIKFDTFGESRLAYQFFVNALGVQADATQEDFRGDDTSWDTLWDSAGRITDTGYFVEMAIPLKSLRFPDSVDGQQWGMEILRFYSRDFRHRIASSPVDRDIACNICQFDQLHGLIDVKPSQNLRLVPTLVLGQSEHRVDAFAPFARSEVSEEVGLDLRWGITQDMVLNATVNPDFSQVEADAAQLDINNPFTLFLQEKRPFFLDGQDYFNTLRQLVYTRNLVAPDYGLKVTGQSNNHSYGAFVVNDEQTNILVPGRLASAVYAIDAQNSDNQVLRYAYDLGDKNRFGAMYTNRNASDYSNRVFALDGIYWFDQYHSVAVQALSSKTQNPQTMVDDLSDRGELFIEPTMSGDALVLEFSHSSRNWWGYLDFAQFDKAFRADLGFISQVNYEKVAAGLGRIWFPQKQGAWWSRMSLGGDWSETQDTDELKLNQEFDLSLNLQAILHSEVNLGLRERERYWQGFYFDETTRYLESSIQPFGGLKLQLDIESGDKVDFANIQLGKQRVINPQVEWQLNKHWLSSMEYSHVDFDVPGGDLFTARLTNFRLTYQFSIRSFLRLTLQQTNLSQNPANYLAPTDATLKSRSSQLLYSYKINPQTLFFAGYSDQGYQDDQIERLEKTGRSVFMKFSYAWQL
jgi:hypothetical protein